MSIPISMYQLENADEFISSEYAKKRSCDNEQYSFFACLGLGIIELFLRFRNYENLIQETKEAYKQTITEIENFYNENEYVIGCLSKFTENVDLIMNNDDQTKLRGVAYFDYYAYQSDFLQSIIEGSKLILVYLMQDDQTEVSNIWNNSSIQNYEGALSLFSEKFKIRVVLIDNGDSKEYKENSQSPDPIIHLMNIQGNFSLIYPESFLASMAEEYCNECLLVRPPFSYIIVDEGNNEEPMVEGEKMVEPEKKSEPEGVNHQSSAENKSVVRSEPEDENPNGKKKRIIRVKEGYDIPLIKNLQELLKPRAGQQNFGFQNNRIVDRPPPLFPGGNILQPPSIIPPPLDSKIFTPQIPGILPGPPPLEISSGAPPLGSLVGPPPLVNVSGTPSFGNVVGPPMNPSFGPPLTNAPPQQGLNLPPLSQGGAPLLVGPLGPPSIFPNTLAPPPISNNPPGAPPIFNNPAIPPMTKPNAPAQLLGNPPIPQPQPTSVPPPLSAPSLFPNQPAPSLGGSLAPPPLNNMPPKLKAEDKMPAFTNAPPLIPSTNMPGGAPPLSNVPIASALNAPGLGGLPPNLNAPGLSGPPLLNAPTTGSPLLSPGVSKVPSLTPGPPLLNNPPVLQGNPPPLGNLPNFQSGLPPSSGPPNLVNFQFK